MIQIEKFARYLAGRHGEFLDHHTRGSVGEEIMPMAFRSRGIVIAALLLTTLPAFAGAGDPLIPKQKGAARTIGLFNFLCLKQLPDLEGIERAAGFGEFDQLTGEDLAPYVPPTPTEKLHAWRYHDHGEEYVLIAGRAKPSEAFKKVTPVFADSTQIWCQVLVAGGQPLIGELTRVMGRAPDETRQEGIVHTSSWTHRQSNALSSVQYAEWTFSGSKVALTASIFLKK